MRPEDRDIILRRAAKAKENFVVCTPEKYFITGALGGLYCGWSTGFFSLERMPPATSPLPPNLPDKYHNAIRLFAQCSGLGWRVFKRMFTGALLYPTLVCQLQEATHNVNASLFNCAVGGYLTGSIFGLRGGYSGNIRCALFMGLLGTISEALQRVTS